MTIANVISLFGGVALFLFGMRLMGDGLKKVAGNKLELVLWKLSGTPLKGVLLGAIVTAVIQSSSATSAMAVGFVNSGIMTIGQSISIVMGAEFGTSITGWILCLSGSEGAASGWASLLSTATLTAIIALIGIIFVMFSKNEVKQKVGGIMLGFSVLMYGMSAMSAAVAPLKQSESFRSLLTMFTNPILGILVGIVITSLLQSNSASVGILQALSVTGAISYSLALPMIMGMGIGASVPVLLSAVGANKNGKRTSLVYLLINLIGAIVCASVFYLLNTIFHFSFMEDGVVIDRVGIATLNSLYRLIAITILFPFTKGLEKLTFLIVPAGKDEEKEKKDEIEKLEERFIIHPALAIKQSEEALLHMAKISKENLFLSIDMLEKYSPEEKEQISHAEDLVDQYEDRLGTYLVKLTGGELNHEQNKQISLFLHTIGNFERISDHSLNIAEVAEEINKKNIVFSETALQELAIVKAALNEVVSLTFDAFETGDREKAYLVEPLEDCIDNLCQAAKLNHIQRLQKQGCTLQQGFVFNDILSNFERVADHCSNIAVALIELNQDSFDTHEYLSHIKNGKNEDFIRNFDRFSEKYQIEIMSA